MAAKINRCNIPVHRSSTGHSCIVTTYLSALFVTSCSGCVCNLHHPVDNVIPVLMRTIGNLCSACLCYQWSSDCFAIFDPVIIPTKHKYKYLDLHRVCLLDCTPACWMYGLLQDSVHIAIQIGSVFQIVHHRFGCARITGNVACYLRNKEDC